MGITMGPAETARAPAASGDPNVFGRYRLLARIGIGGMAEVYRAVVNGPEGFERELVVKRILPQLSGNNEFVGLFIREAKISALLMHPNIVQIYEFGAAEGNYFITMESVRGVTLREALSKLRVEQRAMPFMVAADIARQICTGLDYAHTLRGPDGAALHIVHQDISPTNVMLAYNGTVKLLDFGIARAASFAEDERKKGSIRGKVSYLAPEQVNMRPIDHRADIFALGTVMHEMLTGVRLFQAKNDVGRMRQLLAQPIPPPSSVNAAIPRELDRIVMQALEVDPDRRYASAATMAADLERTLIAARYSSRDLSRMLHGLFLPAEEPLVLVDGQPPPPPTTAPVERIPPTERVRPVRAATPTPLQGALLEERSRLVWERWRVRAKLLGGAIAVAAVVCGAVIAWRQFGSALLAGPAPAAAEAAPVVAPAPAPQAPPPPQVTAPAHPKKRRSLK
jgi:serine/threonine protein kinase